MNTYSIKICLMYTITQHQATNNVTSLAKKRDFYNKKKEVLTACTLMFSLISLKIGMKPYQSTRLSRF